MGAGRHLRRRRAARRRTALPPRRVEPTTPFVPFPASAVEQSIPARFEQQVREHADGLAVRTPQLALTYTALNHAANRVARAVMARAVGASEPIALLFEHGAPMLVALLGVLKAGKCFVALDPTYPRGRLTTMLSDTDSRLLITGASSRSLAQQLAGPGVHLLDVDALDPALPSDDLALPIAPDASPTSCTRRARPDSRRASCTITAAAAHRS